MLPTHALAGMAIALPLVVLSPEHAAVGLLAGFLGGIFPDLDMYVGHRKTFHYPVYFSIAAVLATVLAIAVTTTLSVAVALFLLGAALHALSDVFGGGLELRPWEGRSDRAVYDHYRDRWIPPRRAIRYDGAPEDFLLSGALAVPLLLVVGTPFRELVLLSLAIGGVYVVLRRLLPSLATVLVTRIPSELRSYVPDRYLEDLQEEQVVTSEASAQ